MKFSIRTLLLLLGWLAIICACFAYSSVSGNWIRKVTELFIHSSFLIALAIGLLTDCRRSKAFCFGYSIVGVGLLVLAHFSIYDPAMLLGPIVRWFCRHETQHGVESLDHLIEQQYGSVFSSAGSFVLGLAVHALALQAGVIVMAMTPRTNNELRD